MSNFFDREEVLEALENDGYFIHNNTSDDARREATELGDSLGEYLNKLNGFENNDWDKNRIVVINREIPPECDLSVITRNDMFSNLHFSQGIDEAQLISELENYRK